MIGNKFKYALIDFSYILSRNLFAASKDKKVGEYSESDVVRITIQTLNKIARDFNITYDKPIFLLDKWDRTLGGYIRHWLLRDVVPYKGTRKWMTAELLDEMRCDPNIKPEEIEAAERELYQNQVKAKAKKIMINEFGNLGMPVIGVDGYEADDLAWIASCILSEKGGDKPSVLVTKDSDQLYSTSPYVSYFKIPTGGSLPEIITYDQMCEKIPQELRACGVSLYEYNAYMNSFGYSHNDNLKTIRSGVDPTQAIINIKNGSYNDLNNPEAFKAQMNSFDVTQFPRLEEALDLIKNHLDVDGSVGSLETFHNFCQRNNITGISDRYYSDFVSRFDQKLYSK